jgi:Zn-dependent protease
METLQFYGYLLIGLAVAISVHEAAHAFIAYKLGDPTAKNQGRLTLNPLKHLDPIGTLMLFIARFGWGKPVPVNPHNFKNPVRDSALTAFAGPASNFITALILSVPLKYIGLPLWLMDILWLTLDINIILGIFNLLPFPPLDGSKIFAIFVPKRFHKQYFTLLKNSEVGFMIFIVADIFLIRNFLGYSILWSVLSHIFVFVKGIILLGS